MGGSKQPSQTTQTQKIELPKWVDQASQQNYNSAVELSKQPYQGYTGQTVADLTGWERQAGGTLAKGIDTTNTALGLALREAGKTGSYTPSMVTAQQVDMPSAARDVAARSFLDADVNKYMNPFTESVVNTTLADMDRGLANQQESITSAAQGNGAFGGSRFAVQSAVLGAEGERAKASTGAGLRNAAFQDAAGRITNDNQSALQAALANQNSDLTTSGQKLQAQGMNQSASLQAALANQSAGLQAAGLNSNTALGRAQLALNTGQTASDTAGRNALLSSQLGASERAIEQAKLDSARSAFEEQRDYPTEMLNMRLAALGMSPYGKTSATTSTGQQASSSNGLMTGIGAAAAILPLLFSDRKTKKNVKKKGKVPGTDLNTYEFEYKKEFGGPGKQTGLMAQDVERKVPEAVHEVRTKNGKTVKAVDYPLAILNGGKKRDGRNDKGKMRRPYAPRRAA